MHAEVNQKQKQKKKQKKKEKELKARNMLTPASRMRTTGKDCREKAY